MVLSVGGLAALSSCSAMVLTDISDGFCYPAASEINRFGSPALRHPVFPRSRRAAHVRHQSALSLTWPHFRHSIRRFHPPVGDSVWRAPHCDNALSTGSVSEPASVRAYSTRGRTE